MLFVVAELLVFYVFVVFQFNHRKQSAVVEGRPIATVYLKLRKGDWWTWHWKDKIKAEAM